MNRLKNLLKFSAPKGPGYRLSSGFYLSVLATRNPMPSLLQIIHPQGADGAVHGFGVPLAQQTDKSELIRPLHRGAYGLASLDRKTVLRMTVVSKEEAGFDPQAIVRSSFAAEFGPEVVNRIGATWSLLQFTFESHDPEVLPALNFLITLVTRIGGLTDGIIADPLAETYRLPEQYLTPSEFRIDHHLSVTHGTTSTALVTHGMAKINQPEIVLPEVPPELTHLATPFLLGVGESVFRRGPLRPGVMVGSPSAPFSIAESGSQPVSWELIPARGQTVEQCLMQWKP
jgi:hypothetical protein